jgi:DNA-binding transcriptional regulator LsrR (DeoR family)
MIPDMNEANRKKIKMALFEKGIKQTHLAKELGISRQYVSELLNHGGGSSSIWESIASKAGFEVVLKEREG